MKVVELVFAVGWAAFWLYWIVAAALTRRKRGRHPWGRELRIRAVLGLVIVLLIRLGAFRGDGYNSDLWRGGLGLVLFGAGLAFAVWARVHIGRNWGTPMTEKESPDLVTTGPYRWVRNPIYSGLILAMIGTAIAVSGYLLVVVAVLGGYFVYSAVMEQRFLEARFPDSYPAYRRSTKMLVPFVF